MNDIAARQNNPELLELQAAKNCLYDRARRVAILQACISVVIPLALAGAKALYFHLSAWIAAYGVAALVVEPELEAWQARYRGDAARVQEMFDRTLFELPWPQEAMGREPTTEEVKTWSRTNLHRTATWRDWYPAEVGHLPLGLARVVCQRTNGWWDGTLRERYATLLSWVANGLAIAVLTVGALRQETVLEVAALVTLLAPVLRWARDGARRQRASAVARHRLFEWTERVCRDAIGGSISEADVERAGAELQRETYDQRRASPLIPLWLYRRSRQENEETARAAVRLLIREYRAGRGGRQ